MVFEFAASKVVCYVEDDVCVVSFANSDAEEPEKYLILSQTLFDSGEDDDEIGVEYGKDGIDVTGGVKSALLNSTLFILEVDPDIVGVSEFRITLGDSSKNDLKKHLRKIFSKSSAHLTFV
jgi:hypothetical protein